MSACSSGQAIMLNSLDARHGPGCRVFWLSPFTPLSKSALSDPEKVRIDPKLAPSSPQFFSMSIGCLGPTLSYFLTATNGAAHQRA